MSSQEKLLRQPFETVREYLEWRMADGTLITLEEMQDSHLQNTAIMLDKKQKSCDELQLGIYTYAGLSAQDWIDVIRKELNYRKQSVIVADTKVTL